MDRSTSVESLDIKIKCNSDEKIKVLESSNSLGSSRRSLSQGSVSYERLRSLKLMVDRAIKEHRIFSVAGPFPTIRQALKQRGWLEKMGTSAVVQQPIPARRKRTSHGKHGCEGDENDGPDPLLVARLLRNCTPDLLWALRSETVDWRGLARWQLVNRFPKALFTTKVGLSCALQHMQWFTEEGVSETLFPRSYCVNQQDELVGFINDFRLTACYGMLRHITGEPPPSVPQVQEVRNEESNEENQLPKQPLPPQPPPVPQIFIPPKAIAFALARAGEHVRHLRHEDVDDWSVAGGPSLGPNSALAPGGPGEGGRVWDCEWDQFLTYYYQLVHDGATIKWDTQQQKEELLKKSKDALHQYERQRPYQNHDGTLNLWIVKPGARSCGRGIHVMNRLESIVSRTQPGLGKEARFVVQKYIERPLLIYNTKFDIRQWFLVTCAQPLTIWMYRESYLRFCSQIFDMTNLHESVHLSNNAVQCRYQNCTRDPALPDENMWDCYTFQTYLRSIGRAEAWDEIIYPGMKAGIIGAMLASQDWLDSQRNCFELYGADFLLSEGDMKPWLLEVNCSPCMAPSTSVTARMCAQCLEDVLRVVVDRRDDREASTGMFDLVYRQNSPPAPPYQGVALAVKGKRLTASKPRRRHKHRKSGIRKGATSRGASSSCTSSCSDCSSDDEGRVDAAAQARVTLASPLKVMKAEINAPLKPKKTSSSIVNQILNPTSQLNPEPLSASELRIRLEKLLAESARENRQTRRSSNASAEPGSRVLSARTVPSSTTPPAVVNKPTKTKKSKKSNSSGKFKGKISGKNITVLQRENDIKYVKETKSNKQSKLVDKIKKKESKNLKSHIETDDTCIKCDEEVEEVIEEENQTCQDNNNNTEVQELLLQPDNLRHGIKEALPEIADEGDDCFRDPSRSLALVKEWRRRLEATRASCEQMLAQLKAFRDPPVKPRPLISSQEFHQEIIPCNSDSCMALGKKLRNITSKDKILTAPSPA